jgi:hypothetical protein
LLPIGTTSEVFEGSILKDKVVDLGFTEGTSGTYEPEVIGGAIPLPRIVLYTDEGYGLHIRSAEEMNEVILALAKRIQILENK